MTVYTNSACTVSTDSFNATPTGGGWSGTSGNVGNGNLWVKVTQTNAAGNGIEHLLRPHPLMSAQSNGAAGELAATAQLRSVASDRPGRRIRQLRVERGLSRAEVARASGFSIREVLRIERGRGTLAYDDWRALAGGLGVDVSEIVPADVEPSGGTLTSTPEGGEDKIPWEQFDLELEEFVGRVRDDLSSDNGVLSEALASLDTEDPRVASPPPAAHERCGNSLCASNEFRLRLAALDNLCVRFVTAEGADEPVALAAEITTAVERVRACHEFGESAHVVVPIHR